MKTSISTTKTLRALTTLSLLTTLTTLSIPSPSAFENDFSAFENDLPTPDPDLITPRRSQPSSKLLAITIRVGCPTPDLLADITQHGENIGASNTLFPEVQGASLCPATIYGPMWGKSTGTDTIEFDWRGNIEGTFRFSGGVTVGLHYINAR